jgi:hypothetical protein
MKWKVSRQSLIVFSFFLLATAILLALVAACSNEAPTRWEKDPQELWIPLGLNADAIFECKQMGDVLYVAAGGRGVLAQEPAFLGDWTELGLRFPEFIGSGLYRGVVTIGAGDGELFAGGAFPGSDERPRLYAHAGDTVWVARDSSLIQANMWDIEVTGKGTVIGVSTKEVFLSMDCGHTWSSSPVPQINLGLLHSGSAGVFLAWQTVFFEPRLSRSVDEGETWQGIDVQQDPFPREGSIQSIAATADALYLTMSGVVYRSIDWGETFEAILTLGQGYGTILINDTDPQEIVVASDSLYYSRDRGFSWNGYAAPRGERVGSAACADWGNRAVAIVDWLGADGAMYCLNLRALDSGGQ